MKRVFLKFPKQGHLPRIISRRQRIGSGRHNIAYKSDADDDDEEILQKKLKSFQDKLSEKLSKEAKEEVEKQIKALEKKLADAEEKAKKDAPDVAKLEKELAEIKAANVLRDEADKKNQKALDDILAKQNEKKFEKKSIHFGSRLYEGIMAKEGDFRNLKKGGRVSIDLMTPEETKAAADMVFATNFPTADVSVAFLKPGIIELPKRKLHIRELLQGGGMDNKSTFNFVKETTTTGAPLPAAEGALKEQIALNLVEAQVPAEWLAAFIRISRNMLDDVTGMVTFLNSRLPELLLRAEDNQLLNGNGTSPNLSGITDSGNYTAATGTGGPYWEDIIHAIAQLESYDREANGILMHPTNYWNAPLYKGTTRDYSQPPIVNVTMNEGMLRVGGVPVFRSTAATLNQFIVGDWNMGANLITREPARVEFFYEDGINVRENKVTVRIEERIAFPIYGDNYFIVGTLGANS